MSAVAGPEQPGGERTWARGVTRLSVAGREHVPGWAIEGKRVTSPVQGFGRLWQRRYHCDLGTAIEPATVVREWRAHFESFWPAGSRFFGDQDGISPGDIAPVAVTGPGGMQLTTGILVLYADDEAFTFMTPEGHMFAGLITFGAQREPSGGTTASVDILMRANDPLYDLAMPVMRRAEDAVWPVTLRNLGAYLGAERASLVVRQESEILDRRRLWHNAGNIRHNAVVRSVAHTATYPARALRRRRPRS